MNTKATIFCRSAETTPNKLYFSFGKNRPPVEADTVFRCHRILHQRFIKLFKHLQFQFKMYTLLINPYIAALELYG